MKTLVYQLVCLYGLLLAGSAYSQATSSSRPNIIFIMVDDMGYADLSSYGRKDYQTPVLDAFIKEGMNFKQAYSAAPVCTPTRVAFMTGRFPARNETGLREPLTMSQDDINVGLSSRIPTISSLLKKNGYETALFGKWHLGVTPEFMPTRHGFDHFFGCTSGAVDYMDYHSVNPAAGKFTKTKKVDLYENDQPVERKGYLTDLITEQAITFIKKKHTKPFFLSLQYTAPHWPWQAPGDGPSPDSIPMQQKAKPGTYAAMVKNLDENIGKFLQALQENGLADSTLIIFTSDNGGEAYSDMGPFKGKKMELWEGGIRVPAAVRWPGIVKPGSECNQPVITMDWTVTILEAAQTKYPKDWDGINLISHLKGNTSLVPRTFYWRTSNRVQAHAFRQGDWKYLQTPQGEYLFNLAQDPYESKDLKEQMPAQFSALKAAFKKWDNQMLPPLVLAVPAVK